MFIGHLVLNKTNEVSKSCFLLSSCRTLYYGVLWWPVVRLVEDRLVPVLDKENVRNQQSFYLAGISSKIKTWQRVYIFCNDVLESIHTSRQTLSRECNNKIFLVNKTWTKYKTPIDTIKVWKFNTCQLKSQNLVFKIFCHRQAFTIRYKCS